MPESLQARDGSGRAIELVDTPPLLFEGATRRLPGGAGRRRRADRRGARQLPAPRSTPGGDDKDLVIPLANHTAVVVHTRRLLRETVYLQDYLEQLIEQANALIIATDIEGRVTVWNRAMNRVTGFSRGEVLGKPLLPWLTQLGAPDVGRVLKQVAASGTPATREVRLPTVGGAMLRAAFNVVAVRGPAGAPAAVLGIGQDVTALRQLQSQVIHAEKLATLGQIAAGVAHEINNPLTSIQVCAATVARKASQALDGKVPGSLRRRRPGSAAQDRGRRRAHPALRPRPGQLRPPLGQRGGGDRRQRGCWTRRCRSASTCSRAPTPRWSATTPATCPASRRCATRSCRWPST